MDLGQLYPMMSAKYLLLTLFGLCVILHQAESLESPNARIAQLNEFPSVVSIGDKFADNPITSQFCSGTVITKRHVLTRAQCLHLKCKTKIQVFGGSNDIMLCDRYDVKSYIKYNKWAYANGKPEEPVFQQIAIIELENQIDESKIALAYLSNKPLKTHDGFRATIVGWSISNDVAGSHVLHAADATLLHKMECVKTASTAVRKFAIADEKIVCSDSDFVLSKEDVGGPLFYGKNILIAVNMEMTQGVYWPKQKVVNFHMTYHNYRRFIYEATEGEQLQTA